MNAKLIANIAQSLLLARWRQTLVAAIGVTFSITMFITLLSFMTGLNVMLDSLILNRTPHVRLFNEIKPNKEQPITKAAAYKNYYHFISSIKTSNSREELYNSGAILKAIQQDTRVQGLAPRLNTQVFFNVCTNDITWLINGSDVQS